MRTGLLIYGDLDQISGGYFYDRQLVDYLCRSGDLVEVISLPWRGYPGHLLDNWRSDVFEQLRNLDLDVLIQDELNHPSLIRPNRRLQRKFPIVSLVHHLRGSEPHTRLLQPLYRAVEARYLASVDAFIFNSRTTRAAVQQALGGKLPVHTIAQPGGGRLNPTANHKIRREMALAPGPLRILFVGNLIPRKNLHELLGALGRLEPGSWQLTIVGSPQSDSRYAAKMRRLVRRMRWQDYVRFAGPLLDEALIAEIGQHHIFALASYEGFGIAHLEALGNGLPAIGSRDGASWEVIEHGVSGFLVEPGDLRQLAGYLRELSQDRERLARMASAARARFLSMPTWEQSMSNIREFIAHL